jgi:SWI/SNF-related matrix-associated actin-dependent regulator 1 of chromatin subfamily A
MGKPKYLRKRGDIYFWTGPFDTKDAPKKAGFRWHNPINCRREGSVGRCRACKAKLAKVWWTGFVDQAAKLAEYADDNARVELDAHNESVRKSRAATTELEFPSPEGLEFLPYQKAGIEYMMDRPGTLLADEMGCIEGDALISINRAGKGFKVRMRDLVAKFNGGSVRGNSWDPEIPTMVRSLGEGGVFRLQRLVGAYDKGVRDVVLVELENGASIKMTPDHEVKVPSGWVSASDLRPGDVVLCNGLDACPSCGGSENLITYRYAAFPGYCKPCMYRLKRKNREGEGQYRSKTDGYVYVTEGVRFHPRKPASEGIPEHRLAMEAHLNRMPYTEWREIVRSGSFSPDHVFLEGDVEVHHVNGDRSDNRVENLKVVGRPEHKSLHGIYRNFKCAHPKEVRVVSVSPAGKTDVYDLTVGGTHNFVANGVVVHNCGKTVQSLGVVNTDTSVETVLVFCPASLRINWLREAQRWLTRPFNFFLVEKTTDIPGPEYNFVIVSYTCAAGRGSKKLQAALMERDWDALICDEVHLLKNKTTSRAKLVLGYYSKAKKAKIPGLSAKADRKMYLSGTPMPNKPIEMQGILGDLAPQTFGYVISYGRRYCDGYQSRWGWNFDGASNLDELQEKARGTCMIRRLKADVLKELPPKRRQVICLPTNGASSVLRMEEEAYGAYEDRLESMQAQADLASTSGDKEAYKAAMKALSHLYLISFNEMSRIRREVALAKLPAVIEHLESALETEMKVVVFGHHREVVHRISEHFGGAAVHVTGTTSQKKRQEAVDRFQEDPSVRVFVGNMRAAGVGYTLTAASLVVFAELDWVPSVITQAEDRAHRIGQLHHVLIQHLVYDGSIDSRIAHAIITKQDVADKVLDDPSHLDFECPALPMVKAAPKPKKFPEVSQRERLAAREVLGVLSDHGKLGGLGAALSKKMDGSLPDDREVWMIKRIAKPHVDMLPMEELRVLELD